jgi:hypothetical protein
MGRRPTYDQDAIKPEIIEWISAGKTLRDYCRQTGKPTFVSIYDWLADDADFALRFAHARDTGSDVIADEVLSIIDAEPLAVHDDLGNKRYDSGSISWNKNRAEQRMKLLACWNPRKYGQRTVVAGDDAAPIVLEVKFDIFGEMLKNLALQRHAEE